MYNIFTGQSPDDQPIFYDDKIVKNLAESVHGQQDLKHIIQLAVSSRKAELQAKIDQLNKAKVRLIDSLAGEGTKICAPEISDQVRGMVADTNNLKASISDIDNAVDLVFKALGDLLDEASAGK